MIVAYDSSQCCNSSPNFDAKTRAATIARNAIVATDVTVASVITVATKAIVTSDVTVASAATVVTLRQLPVLRQFASC